MSYDFTLFKKRLEEIAERVTTDMGAIRTGRATPALLDSVAAESYGSRTPIKHLASITIEDPRTLRVTPWDKSQIKAIESGIAGANLGVGTAVDSGSLRVTFPELTTERRALLTRHAKEKIETSRVAIRKAREEVWGEIQMKERSAAISEDEKFRYKDELQKLVDTANGDLDALLARKENEIAE